MSNKTKFFKWLSENKGVNLDEFKIIQKFYNALNTRLYKAGKINIFKLKDYNKYLDVINEHILLDKEDDYLKLYFEFLLENFSNETVYVNSKQDLINPKDDTVTKYQFENNNMENDNLNNPYNFIKEEIKKISKFLSDEISLVSKNPEFMNVNIENVDSIYFDLSNCLYYYTKNNKSHINKLLNVYEYGTKLFACNHNGIYPDVEQLTTFSVLSGLSQNSAIINKSIDKTLRYIKSYNGALCLLPDILDEFNSHIRKNLLYNGKNIFPVPKSVALSFYLLQNGELQVDHQYVVLDFDVSEFSAIRLSLKLDKVTNEKIIVRHGMINVDSDKYLNYHKLSKFYLDEYLKKYKININQLTYDNLINTKSLISLLNNQKPLLIMSDNNYINIIYDQLIVNQMNSMILENIKRFKKEFKSLKGSKVFVINSLISEFYDSEHLFIGLSEIENRLKNHQLLWEEYLPKLSLEVINNGHYDNIELIKENVYRDVLKTLDSEEVINVEGELTFYKGVSKFSLPLEREIIGDINKEKIAYFYHDSFPLDRDIKMKLEIRYKYGDENSYRLIAYPLDSDNAPFLKVENIWRDAEQNKDVKTPNYECKIHEMSNSSINTIINGFDYVIRVFRYLKQNKSIRNEYVINNVLNCNQCSMFRILNFNYKERRRFFTHQMYTNEKVKECIDYLFNMDFFINLYKILVNNELGNKLPSEIFSNLEDEYKIVKQDLQWIVADCSLISDLPLDGEKQDIVNRLVEYFFNESNFDKRDRDFNKKYFELLIKISRCVIQDKYKIFDKINTKIISKFDLSYLRTMSSNCWDTKEWIYNLYYAKDGEKSVNKIVNEILKYLNKFEENKFDTWPYTVLYMRDVLELFLCVTRLKELDNNLLKSSSKVVKQAVKKIKLIDSCIYKNKTNLKNINVKIKRDKSVQLRFLSYICF